MDENSAKSLDELLGDEVTPIEADPVESVAETGVEPQEPAEPVPPTDKLPREDYKAVREERDKRQAIERELQALKDQFQAVQNPPAPPPSIWEDEEAARQHDRNQTVGEASFNAKLDMSEMLASQAHEDFDEMKAKFVEMMALNPALQQQALAARHPWEHAYQAAKNAARIEEIGATDIDTLKAKLRDELMAEMGQAPRPAGLPPTLTGERNVGTRNGPAWSGPKSLDDLLR